MIKQKKNWDLYAVQFATSQQKETYTSVLSRAKKSSEDANKHERLEKSECKVCYYLYPSRIGGNVTTVCHCGICGKEMRFGNTCVDEICLDCAKEHRLCCHCGGTIDLRDRRKQLK
tara:strand:- start:910 stop:1257 length:348 start_codon:yes stop_codon:yes gene_type:complete